MALDPATLKKLESYQIIILVGLPGSGKSRVAHKLRKKLSAVVLSSDTLREEIFSSDRYDKVGHAVVINLSAQVYDIMYNKAGELWQQKQKVILDATHLHTQKRVSHLQQLLTSIPASDICYFVVNTPEDTIKKHMRQNESLFADWQRVTTDFQRDFSAGILSWPNQDTETIAVYYLYDTA